MMTNVEEEDTVVDTEVEEVEVEDTVKAIKEIKATVIKEVTVLRSQGIKDKN